MLSLSFETCWDAQLRERVVDVEAHRERLARQSLVLAKMRELAQPAQPETMADLGRALQRSSEYARLMPDAAGCADALALKLEALRVWEALERDAATTLVLGQLSLTYLALGRLEDAAACLNRVEAEFSAQLPAYAYAFKEAQALFAASLGRADEGLAMLEAEKSALTQLKLRQRASMLIEAIQASRH